MRRFLDRLLARETGSASPLLPAPLTRYELETVLPLDAADWMDQIDPEPSDTPLGPDRPRHTDRSRLPLAAGGNAKPEAVDERGTAPAADDEAGPVSRPSFAVGARPWTPSIKPGPAEDDEMFSAIASSTRRTNEPLSDPVDVSATSPKIPAPASGGVGRDVGSDRGAVDERGEPYSRASSVELQAASRRPEASVGSARPVVDDEPSPSRSVGELAGQVPRDAVRQPAAVGEASPSAEVVAAVDHGVRSESPAAMTRHVAPQEITSVESSGDNAARSPATVRDPGIVESARVGQVGPELSPAVVTLGGVTRADPAGMRMVARSAADGFDADDRSNPEEPSFRSATGFLAVESTHEAVRVVDGVVQPSALVGGSNQSSAEAKPTLGVTSGRAEAEPAGDRDDVRSESPVGIERLAAFHEATSVDSWAIGAARSPATVRDSGIVESVRAGPVGPELSPAVVSGGAEQSISGDPAVGDELRDAGDEMFEDWVAEGKIADERRADDEDFEVGSMVTRSGVGPRTADALGRSDPMAERVYRPDLASAEATPAGRIAGRAVGEDVIVLEQSAESAESAELGGATRADPVGVWMVAQSGVEGFDADDQSNREEPAAPPVAGLFAGESPHEPVRVRDAPARAVGVAAGDGERSVSVDGPASSTRGSSATAVEMGADGVVQSSGSVGGSDQSSAEAKPTVGVTSERAEVEVPVKARSSRPGELGDTRSDIVQQADRLRADTAGWRIARTTAESQDSSNPVATVGQRHTPAHSTGADLSNSRTYPLPEMPPDEATVLPSGRTGKLRPIDRNRAELVAEVTEASLRASRSSPRTKRAVPDLSATDAAPLRQKSSSPADDEDSVTPATTADRSSSGSEMISAPDRSAIPPDSGSSESGAAPVHFESLSSDLSWKPVTNAVGSALDRSVESPGDDQRKVELDQRMSGTQPADDGVVVRPLRAAELSVAPTGTSDSDRAGALPTEVDSARIVAHGTSARAEPVLSLTVSSELERSGHDSLDLIGPDAHMVAPAWRATTRGAETVRDPLSDQREQDVEPIIVHIGRIEVRKPKQLQQSSPKRRPRQPNLSLGDYLERRSRRGR